MVREAGIDVSDWEKSKGKAASAAANPKYCYNWSFVALGKLVVLNLWHSGFKEQNGNIIVNWNAREIARISKGITVRRATQVDEAIESAFREKLAVRVVICAGKIRDRTDPNSPPSKVSFRSLDPEPWHIASYNRATGESVVMRGLGKGEDRYTDQFDLDAAGIDPVKKVKVVSNSFVRRPEIRRLVLLRSKGKCEYCGEAGFKKGNGKVYLETHHIKPLSEHGSDTLDNVAALCPNHHREAHHGKIRSKISKTLLKLAGK
jgi:5-methylcytosine-specific restriction protein A